jgi:hypothetical protein
MEPLPPFRERTAIQLREQAEVFRNKASATAPAEAQRLIRLAERYEELARLREMAGECS